MMILEPSRKSFAAIDLAQLRLPTTLACMLAALALLHAAPAPAQSQSAAIEYYMQPDVAGTSTLAATTSGLALSSDLSGVNVTFNTGGFFARELVSQSAIGFSADIDVTVPAFSGTVPGAETSLDVSAGSFTLTTPEGEIIQGDAGAGSTLRVVPYAPAPRVLFYELTLVPASTWVIPPQSARFQLDEIKTWGILVTDGQSFQGAFGFGQNHQYLGSATF